MVLRGPPVLEGEVRIIAGQFKGLRLATPDDRAIRPTPDRVREALFNLLWSKRPEWFEGADDVAERPAVLDVFGGTGAVALECLSRGFSRAVIIEKAPPALAIIQDNLRRARIDYRVLVRAGDALDGLARLSPVARPLPHHEARRFDLIYVDPPYDSGLQRPVLASVARGELLEAGGLVVVETRRGLDTDPLPEPLARVDGRQYGETCLDFFEEV